VVNNDDATLAGAAGWVLLVMIAVLCTKEEDNA